MLNRVDAISFFGQPSGGAFLAGQLEALVAQKRVFSPMTGDLALFFRRCGSTAWVAYVSR